MSKLKNGKISFGEKIAFGIGDSGCNFIWSTIGSFLTLYYTDNVGISAAIVGTIMLVTRLLDGISDLGMGAIIDRTHTRWGKARPWILWTAPLMCICMILMFNVPSGLSLGGKTAYATITYIVMAVFVYTACNLAYNTLLSLITDDKQDRMSMSSIRFFFTMSTMLIISYNTTNLVNRFGYTGMALIYGLLGMVLLLITFFGTKEHYKPSPSAESSKLSVGQSFKALFKNKYFLLVTLLFVVNYFALNCANGIGIYYARDVLGNAGLFGSLTLCFILPKLLGNLVLAQITRLFGKWKLMMIGYVVQIIGVALIIIFPTNIMMIFTGLILKGIGSLPHNAGLFALVADVIDYGEWKTGHRIDGLVNSATSFGMKVGTGFGTAAVGWLLAWGGYNADLAVQSSNCLLAMNILYGWIPMILFIIGLIVMGFCNLDKSAAQIRNDLAARKASEKRDEKS